MVPILTSFLLLSFPLDQIQVILVILEQLGVTAYAHLIPGLFHPLLWQRSVQTGKKPPYSCPDLLVAMALIPAPPPWQVRKHFRPGVCKQNPIDSSRGYALLGKPSLNGFCSIHHSTIATLQKSSLKFQNAFNPPLFFAFIVPLLLQPHLKDNPTF